MAVIVTDQPEEYVSRLPHVRWKLQATTATSYPNYRAMFYRPEIIGVGYIWPERRMSRAIGIDVPVDISRDLAPYVGHSLPALDDSTPTTLPESKILVRLEYGEYEVNVETGVKTELSLSNTTNVNVVDAAQQFFDRTLLDLNFPARHEVLTRRPLNFSVGLDQSDWIYVITNAGDFCEVTVTLYDSAGSILYATVFFMFSGQVGYVPIGGANFIDNAGGIDREYWYYATVEIENVLRQGAAGPLTYTIYYRDDLCNSYDKEVLFREPIGGFSSLQFESVEIGNDRNVGTFMAPYFVSPVLEENLPLSSAGLSVNNLQNFLTFTYKRKFPARDAYRYRWFLMACASSREHHIKTVLPNGDIAAIPAVVESSNIQSFSNSGEFEFQITLKAFKPIVTA